MKIGTLLSFSARIAAAVATGAVMTSASAEGPAPDTPEAAQAAEIAMALADLSVIPAGKKSFFKCQACHMVGENIQRRAGPPLNGVIGRTAATVEGFRYSPGMQTAAEDGLVWTVERLDAYLAAPREIVPGTTMGFAGLANPEERKALIAYLASFKADGSRVEGAAE